MEDFRGRFHFRLFRRRGVNLLLLCNLLTTTVISATIIPPTNIPPFILNIIYGFGICIFSIAGCLGDFCYGRYKLIKIGMWLTWVSVLLQAATSIVFHAMGVALFPKWVPIGLINDSSCLRVSVLSNIIQFGMDQLRDAPTTEITSFIVWYMWTWNFGVLLGAISMRFSYGHCHPICSCLCKLGTVSR